MNIRDLSTEFAPKDVVSGPLSEQEACLLPGLQPREWKMRCSGLPGCSILWYLSAHAHRAAPNGHDSAGLSYFAGIGTTVHLHFQRFTAHTGRMLGNYKCRVCGHEQPMSTRHICDKCGGECEYHEIAFSYGPLTGHIDCLFYHNPRQLTLCDFKTTGTYGLKKQKDTFHINPQYVAQTMTYAWICVNHLKLPVTRFGIMSVARDHYAQRQEFYHDWTYELNDQVGTFIEQQIRGFKAARKALKLRWEEAWPLLYKYRTCKSIEQYKETIQPCTAYEPGGRCRFAEHCFAKNNKGLERAVIKELKGYAG